MKLSELKTEITSILRERSTYKLGTQEYTKKNLTPTDILDLANVFIETPHTKFGKKDGEVVTSMKDLLSLLGKGLDAKVNGKWGKRDTFKVVKGPKPAILHQILKNNLLDKKEYIDLYYKLENKLNLFLPKFTNNDLANRRTPTGAAKAAAHIDMKGEFDESVNEGAGTLTIEKRKDGKYYWQYKFKSGKTEDWPAGFNTKADAQKDFMYRSKYIKESVNELITVYQNNEY